MRIVRALLLLLVALGFAVPPLVAVEGVTDASVLGQGRFSLQIEEINKGDLVVDLQASLEGLTAVTVKVPGEERPFVGAAMKGQSSRAVEEADAMVYLDRGVFGAIPVRTRLRHDLEQATELQVDLYFEDGRHQTFPIRSAHLSQLNIRMVFNRLRCVEVTIDCKSKGKCPSCSNTITCCGTLAPCVTCPGCDAVCSCEVPPEPPKC